MIRLVDEGLDQVVNEADEGTHPDPNRIGGFEWTQRTKGRLIHADHQNNNTRFAGAVADLMDPKAQVPRDELALMIYVCWEASQALLETAFGADPTGDPAIIEQTKIMAARYLAAAFEPQR